MFDRFAAFFFKAKDMLKGELERVRLAKVTIILFSITALCLLVYSITTLSSSNTGPEKVDASISIGATQSPAPSPSPSSEKKIMVHLKGAVQNPGLFALEENSRLNDAIRLAGGTTEDAAIEYINLAEFLTDGSDIYIPTVEEVKADKTGKYTKEVSQTASSSVQSSSSGKQAPTVKVNINTANAQQLCTLPGIGEKTAAAIISYRQYAGSFKSTSDIMNVKGIGDAKYNAIKEYITI